MRSWRAMSGRDAYLHAFLTRYEVVLLPIEGPRGETREALVPLPSIVQPLALCQARGEDGAPGHEDLLQQPATAVLASGGEDALARSPRRRMVVLGGPGTGKTTLLRALAARAARRALADVGAPLPIFVGLPDLAERGPDLRRWLPSMTASLGLPDEVAEILGAALDEGAALVCLDGLDEVAPAKRGALIAWLASLQDAGAWIVGSRFTQYRSGDLGRGVFTEWQLLPLDGPAQRRLAERLLPLLAGPDAPPAARESARFLAALDAHPQASAWKGVPLLFSLTASAWARRGALPASRAALYQIVTEALLAARTPDAEERRALCTVLARAALALFRSGAQTFPAEARAIAERLSGSGLLAEAGGELRFVHQTLQEYLAAVALAGDLAAGGEAAKAARDLAWSKRTFSRWSEPLRLMVGVLVHEHGTAGAGLSIEWLRSLGAQRAAGDPGDLLLSLIVKSLGEIGEPPASWPDLDLAPLEGVLDQWAAQTLAPKESDQAQRGRMRELTVEVARLRLPARGAGHHAARPGAGLGWRREAAPVCGVRARAARERGAHGTPGAGAGRWLSVRPRRRGRRARGPRRDLPARAAPRGDGGPRRLDASRGSQDPGEAGRAGAGPRAPGAARESRGRGAGGRRERPRGPGRSDSDPGTGEGHPGPRRAGADGGRGGAGQARRAHGAGRASGGGRPRADRPPRRP